MNHPRYCPSCGTLVVRYSNPLPTADVVIHDDSRGIVLIRRKNPPLGMALPGGFIEEGESAEHAAVREMKEETGLDIILEGVLGVYSWPLRDMRCHTLTTVFVGRSDAPHILSVSLVGWPSQNIVNDLGSQGICISAGSACHQGKPSQVVAALHLPKKTAGSVVRLSFGPETTREDIDACVQALRRHHDTRMPML